MIALLASVAMFKSLNDTLDPDCFWHLRVAEQLTSQGIGPLVDHFSFNSIKQTWTPYSWLAELSMKSLWNFGGYQAAVVASAAFAGGFVVMVAVSCAALAGPWPCSRSRSSRLSCCLSAARGASAERPRSPGSCCSP